MQVARTPRRHGALDEATLDALSADLTIPHPRPLVDLERDDYAAVEIDQATTRFEPVTAPFTRLEPEAPSSPRPRARRSSWSAAQIVAAVITTALGFGLGAGIAILVG